MARVPRKKKARSLAYQRFFLLIIMFFISPLILLWDSFRRKELPDKSWIFSFFLFMTVVMTLTATSVFIVQDSMTKTIGLMADATGNREVLAGDLQLEIRLINKYALQYNVDPQLIFAIIKTESEFNPKATSRAGARGLMQLMPAVWKDYNKSGCSGRHSSKATCNAAECIYDPNANIRVGVHFFRDLLNRYQNRPDLALEAYNAGIGNVRPGSGPRFKETRLYIVKAMSYWQDLKQSILAEKLQLSLKLHSGLKWLVGLTLFCWVDLFWWASRKWF